jgi:ABC-2 type transport system ATP-binding protein
MPEVMDSPRTTRARGGDAPVVQAIALTKTFRDFWMRSRARAVDGIDLEIRRGEVFGLLGPNGSGKSTTIKMILGLLRKTSGRLAVFGKPATDVSTKKRIGYLPEESYLYPFLNARETLDYYGKLFQIDRRRRLQRIDELLEMVGLDAVQHRQIREYSKGMQRRIGIAQALINDPELLILDEPTTGLDPIGTRQVKDLIITLGQRGKTIILSSHLLSDVEDCVDRMVILYGGKIRAAGTCDELLSVESRTVIETDALDAQTIAELRAVIERRHKRVDRVGAPRQKLEDLFVGIVEQARAERVETAGALNAAGTAAFLRGEGDAAEGEDLLRKLVDRSDAVREAERAAAAAPTKPAQPDSAADVIRTLVNAPDAPPPQPPRTDAPKAPAPDVDESVIRSLLGGAGESGKGGPDGGGGRGT